MGDDDLSFMADLTTEWVKKLHNIVSQKLKEFMGDYTDDTLVEYVIVLLKNGRSKAEARNELNVFLGDDSDSFVSWLWDHLGSSLHLYVESRNSHADEASQINLTLKDKVLKRDPPQLNPDTDKLKSEKAHRSRHNRDWRSLVRDEEAPAPLISAVTDNTQLDEKIHEKVSRHIRSTSQREARKKRNRPEELSHAKAEERALAGQGRRNVNAIWNSLRHVDTQQKKRDSQENTGAARRLLQFAFKDALATSKTPTSTSEPALKRLRSVVSTSAANSSVERGSRHRIVSASAADSSVERGSRHTIVSASAADSSVERGSRRRLQSLACVPNAVSTAIRAVEEAAKDVSRISSSRNVFDRLGLSTDVSHANEQLTEFNKPVIEDVNDTCMASNSGSDNEGYNHVNIHGRGLASGRNEGEDSLTVQYSLAKNGDQIKHKPPRKEHNQTATVVGTSSKILNISVNVNTWKPPHQLEQGEIQQAGDQKAVKSIEPGVTKSSAWSTKEKSTPVAVGNGNIKPAADIRKVSQKNILPTQGLYATGRPTEDVDSRTIFVSNVHFAATKDSLSRHFNKFGEVLKVIIITDAATGQPKGSAYVEFMRKEAAENALSIDGTSFMSRILKVVRKSSAHQDISAMMTWPRAVRGSPFPPSGRFGRGFLPRGGYMARPPIKAGARSLQWKREESNTTPNEEISQPTGVRSLTYVRTENQNTNGRSS